MFNSKNTSTSVADMVRTAIMTLADPTGSSLQAIKKFIIANYGADMEKFGPFIKDYVVSSVSAGTLIQITGKGASGSFRLASVPIPLSKPKAKSKADNCTGLLMTSNSYQLSSYDGGCEVANIGHDLPTSSHYQSRPAVSATPQLLRMMAIEQDYREMKQMQQMQHMQQMQQMQQMQIAKPPRGGKKILKTSAELEMHQSQIIHSSSGGKTIMKAAGMQTMQQVHTIKKANAGGKKMVTNVVQDMQQMQSMQQVEELQCMRQLPTSNLYTGGQDMIDTSVMCQMQGVRASQGVKNVTKVIKTTKIKSTKVVKRKAEADPAQPSKKTKASKSKVMEVHINF